MVYEREHYAALAQSIVQLSAPHTLTFIAFKSRGVYCPFGKHLRALQTI